MNENPERKAFVPRISRKGSFELRNNTKNTYIGEYKVLKTLG
jgi:hypothetical protein